MTRRTLASLLAVAMLALAACGGEPERPDPDPAEEPAEPAEPEPDPPADDPVSPEGPDAAIEPLTDQRTVEPSTAEGGGGLLTVTDVRVGAHEGFDRVVFEIAGEGPAGWHVAYTTRPTTPGQGAPVDIEGQAFLAVYIRGVALPPDAPEHDPWDGERLSAPAGANVVEVVEAGLYEGQHDFFVGVRQQAPFAVVRLDDPQRIVVEIDNP